MPKENLSYQLSKKKKDGHKEDNHFFKLVRIGHNAIKNYFVRAESAQRPQTCKRENKPIWFSLHYQD
jgi:hypothetical protein